MFSNSVLRALLYCHGLVLEDPLLLAADMYLGTRAEQRGIARRFVEAAVISLVEIAPLMRAGIVQTFFASEESRKWSDAASSELSAVVSRAPGLSTDELWHGFEAIYVEGLHPKLQELWQVVRRGGEPDDQLIREAVTSDQLEMVEAFIEIAQDLPAATVAETILDVVSEWLEVAVATRPGRG